MNNSNDYISIDRGKCREILLEHYPKLTKAQASKANVNIHTYWGASDITIYADRCKQAETTGYFFVASSDFKKGSTYLYNKNKLDIGYIPPEFFINLNYDRSSFNNKVRVNITGFIDFRVRNNNFVLNKVAKEQKEIVEEVYGKDSIVPRVDPDGYKRMFPKDAPDAHPKPKSKPKLTYSSEPVLNFNKEEKYTSDRESGIGKFTLREYTALMLEIPCSGTSWLDKMIEYKRDYKSLKVVFEQPKNEER